VIPPQPRFRSAARGGATSVWRRHRRCFSILRSRSRASLGKILYEEKFAVIMLPRSIPRSEGCPALSAAFSGSAATVKNSGVNRAPLTPNFHASTPQGAGEHYCSLPGPPVTSDTENSAGGNLPKRLLAAHKIILGWIRKFDEACAWSRRSASYKRPLVV
jgi:hypothetical protein